MDQAGIPEGLLSEIRKELAMLHSTVDALTAQNKRKDEEIERLNQILLTMQRARFGQSSEKSSYVLGDNIQQLNLFDAAEQDASPPPEAQALPDIEKVPVGGHTRKKKRTLEEMCASLPVEETVIDLPEDEKQNENGVRLVCIGQEYMRTELVIERAKARVVKYYRKVYADRDQENETGDAQIVKPPMPAPLLAHSYVSASVATDILVRKYADGMPLYRQEQMWKRMGVALGRNTMGNWVIQIADFYLKPFWESMRDALRLGSVIHADETVLQVLKEEGRKPTDESRMWVYASAKRADVQIRCFDYRDSRSGECAKDFLDGFHGVLVSDGYSGYNKVPDVTRAGCWAHVRRKWHEAMPKGATAENSKAAQGYALCSRLFAVERELEELSTSERLKKRGEMAAPILAEYWRWLDAIFDPKGKLRDAVIYSQNQKKYLCAFLEHGEIEISNNQVENAIRPFVVGRKGWLFSDTPQGAQASAIVYSLMETAKANGLNLERFIYHLLCVLPDRFASAATPEIHDLLPWNPKIRGLFRLGTEDC